MYEQFKELADVDITAGPMEVGPTTHYIMGGIRVDAETGATTRDRAVRRGRGRRRDARREPARRELAVGPARVRAADRGRRGGRTRRAATTSRRWTRPRSRRRWPSWRRRSARAAPTPRARTASTRSSRRRCRPRPGSSGPRPTSTTRSHELDAIRARWPNIRVVGRPRLQPRLEPRLRGPEHARRGRGRSPAAPASARESRGAHSRIDFPELDEKWGKKNSVVRLGVDGMEVATTKLPKMPDELRSLLAKE